MDQVATSKRSAAQIRPILKNSARRNQNRQKLSTFAKALLREWRKLNLPVGNDAVVVAVSGGADSSALLFALDELISVQKLRIKMIAAHLNHKLRGKESTADARWIANAMSAKFGKD